MKAKPLSDLLRKGVDFQYNSKERQSFQQLKAALVNVPVLKMFRVGAVTELHTDASKCGFEEILFQKDDDGKLHPIYYASKKTTLAEDKLHSYYLEVKSVYYALIKFRIYLLGTKFKVVTDCNAFTSTIKKADVPPAVARWVLPFQEFAFEVEHRKQGRMKHVDAL